MGLKSILMSISRYFLKILNVAFKVKQFSNYICSNSGFDIKNAITKLDPEQRLDQEWNVICTTWSFYSNQIYHDLFFIPLTLALRSMSYDLSGLGEARTISDILQSCLHKRHWCWPNTYFLPFMNLLVNIISWKIEATQIWGCRDMPRLLKTASGS